MTSSVPRPWAASISSRARRNLYFSIPVICAIFAPLHSYLVLLVSGDKAPPEGSEPLVADQSYPVCRDGHLLPRIEPLQAKRCGGSRVPVPYVVPELDQVFISLLTFASRTRFHGESRRLPRRFRPRSGGRRRALRARARAIVAQPFVAGEVVRRHGRRPRGAILHRDRPLRRNR